MQPDIQALDRQYIAGTYRRFPAVLRHGKGSLVYDENEKEYIDLSSGIAVNTFGYADDVWQAAVTAKLGTLQHTSNLYYSEPCAVLASMLCEKTGMSRVFFSNSGAEANECAIKVARKYAQEKKGKEHYHIHHAGKQLPRADDHHACGNRAGGFPPGFHPADRRISPCTGGRPCGCTKAA